MTTFQAMGTTWFATADRSVDAVEPLVRSLESTLSRFLPDSALSRLNRDRRVEDPTLAAATRDALALRDATGGSFDPTLGRVLAAWGYDRTFAELPTRTRVDPDHAPRPDVLVHGDAVVLFGDGDLDLGGIGKGWAIDRAVERLIALGARSGLVDGGGDVRVFGAAVPIGVADDHDVTLDDEAVATSSTRQRAWSTDRGPAHHLLDPRTGRPSASGVDTAVVRAPTCALADALATAMVADPRRTLPHLAALGARAMVRDDAGTWWTTPTWSDDD